MQSECGLSASDATLDPILAAVRERGFRILRLMGTMMLVLNVIALAWRFSSGRPAGGQGMLLALGVALALTALSWTASARRCQSACSALLLTVLGLLPVVGLWLIGPSLTMGSLLVMVPLLATFYLGPRAALPAFAATALELVGIGLASAALGRPAVGSLEGAAVPYGVYARLAITTLGAVGIALAVQQAALGAMEAAVQRAREAARRERAQNEQRVRAERALSRAKRLEAITLLAGGVVHDTRNALTVLSAGLDQLRRSPRSVKDDAVLADMERAATSMSGTLQQLLSLGRREPCAARPVRLSAALAHLANGLRRVVPGDVEVRLEGDGAEAAALLDPGRLEQAVLNLALNARDAMPAGGVLSLRTRLEERDGTPWAVLEVEDTGTGMDAATAARLFEPFFTTKVEGTGLGLTTVRRFVQEAGGDVEVDSVAGRGTRMRLAFPAVTVAA